jgi:phosphoglycolate phosphatase
VGGRLVLWDVDLTLLDAGGAGAALIRRAFTALFGRPFPHLTTSLAGRTDRAIALEVLTVAGIDEPRARLDDFQRHIAALAPQLGPLLAERGRVLPGAAEALAALAGLDAGLVVQSVLTGNMRATAAAKLAAFGLDRYLDLSIGAYGDEHEIRADLVPLARASAAAAHGADFAGRATVLIGDTPLDVEAARLSGARAVGVASGGFSAAELAAAGADAVLPGLADTGRVVAAIGVG